MKEIMRVLAVPMTPFEAYGRTHLVILLLVIAAAFAGAEICVRAGASAGGRGRRQGQFTKRILFLCGAILFLMEILKQLLLTYVRGGSYSWSDFPFQLCSVPMYLCLAYPFLRAEGVKTAIRQFLMTFGLIGAIAALAVPYSSFYSYVLLTAQSLLWHAILLFLALYLWLMDKWMRRQESRLIGRKRGKYNRKPGIAVWNRNPNGQRNLPWGGMLLYLIAAAIAVILNLAFYDVSHGTINMFFFGPGYPDMFLLNDLYQMYGWIPETAAMAAASEAASVVIWVSQRGRS